MKFVEKLKGRLGGDNGVERKEGRVAGEVRRFRERAKEGRGVEYGIIGEEVLERKRKGTGKGTGREKGGKRRKRERGRGVGEEGRGRVGIVRSGEWKVSGDGEEGEREGGEGVDEVVRDEVVRDEVVRDEIERDVFAERLRERDSRKREGRSGEKGMGKEEVFETDDATIVRLRELSRRQYLRKREARELARLKEEIEDEVELFRGQELTKREKRDLETKKRLYELASQRVALLEEDDGRKQETFQFDVDTTGTSRYKIPDVEEESSKIKSEKEKKFALLTKRYRDSEASQKRVRGEQALWEEERIGLGARSATGHMLQAGYDTIGADDEYDLVSDPVEFLDDARDVLEGEGDVGKLRRRNQEDEKSQVRMSGKDKILHERKQLPMWEYRSQLIDAVREHQVLIVVGETGSGKTTQIPQFLIEEGFDSIACTQPRRVAAMSVAARVAHEMGVKLGHEVGYSIRFEDCTSDKTVIKYMTDGMMLREFLSEPDLGSYKVIIVDEAHERSLSTDVVMGLVKDIARFRGSDVRVIIASATVDADKFSSYFDDAPVFYVPGRRYPVHAYYSKAPVPDYLDASVVTTLQIHKSQPRGDILLFLPGQEEIETACEAMQVRTRGLGSKVAELIILPMYSSLPSDLQAKIFEPTPPGARKVVVATNIAETSVTIPGIVYVIDPGFSKQKTYNPKTGLESLIVAPISQAGATQRAGRAGRTQPGKCFRLYTKQAFDKELLPQPIPEILRTNLCQAVLLLMSLGITNLMSFDFIDPPPSSTLVSSLETLYSLGALNARGSLTKLGRRMAELPLSPEMGKSLLASEQHGSSSDVATIAAMLSVNNAVFYRPRGKKALADAAIQALSRVGGGDFGLLLSVYNSWAESGYSTQWCYDNFVQLRSLKRARDIREQLSSLMERVEIEETSAGAEMDKVIKAFTAGFFEQCVRLHKTGYKTIRKPHKVEIHPSSVLFRSEETIEWMIYFELVHTTKEYVRTLAQVQLDWLKEAAPHLYVDNDSGKSKKT